MQPYWAIHAQLLWERPLLLITAQAIIVSLLNLAGDEAHIMTTSTSKAVRRIALMTLTLSSILFAAGCATEPAVNSTQPRRVRRRRLSLPNVRRQGKLLTPLQVLF